MYLSIIRESVIKYYYYYYNYYYYYYYYYYYRTASPIVRLMLCIGINQEFEYVRSSSPLNDDPFNLECLSAIISNNNYPSICLIGSKTNDFYDMNE